VYGNIYVDTFAVKDYPNVVSNCLSLYLIDVNILRQIYVSLREMHSNIYVNNFEVKIYPKVFVSNCLCIFDICQKWLNVL